MSSRHVQSHGDRLVAVVPRRTTDAPWSPAADGGGGSSSQSLVFDDEPIEDVLYGTPGPGPTAADAFEGTRRMMDWLGRLAQRGELNEALGILKSLAAGPQPLSLRACLELVTILARLIPRVPCPILRHDPRGLEPLLEQICAELAARDAAELLDSARNLLFRCHEHLGDFESARRILQDMVEAEGECGDRLRLACNLNNLGFEYLLERRWREALPYFERAAALALEAGDPVEAAVMRSNYWQCRIELDGPCCCANLEGEAAELRNVLESRGDWRARKALILLARLEENRGNLDAAIALAERAVAVARGSATRWPEMDGDYLEQLRASRAAKLAP